VGQTICALTQPVKRYTEEMMRFRARGIDCDDATADLRCLL
jgi:hypothetical protein